MYLADIGVKCHSCGVRFRSRQLPVIVDSGYRNSELRLDLGGAEQFEHFAICTCPSCGMSDWATAFARTQEACMLAQASSASHLQYRSAAIRAEQLGSSFHTVGMFYLYAAWCADDMGAIPQAREYRRLAVDAFRKAIVDGSCPPERRATVEYLIGELMRRAGNFTGASDHLKEVIASLPGRYAVMARKVMRLAQQENPEPIDFSSN